MKGWIGRAIRMWACRRVLADLRRERTSYVEAWQSDTGTTLAHYYAGYRDGLQAATDLIETEYR